MIEHRGVLRLIQVNADYAHLRLFMTALRIARVRPSMPVPGKSGQRCSMELACWSSRTRVPTESAWSSTGCWSDERVTAMFITVGLFNEYVDALEEAFGGLEYLITGGDVLDVGRVAQVLSKQSRPRHLISAYGPTEATAYASTFPIAAVAGAYRPSQSDDPSPSTSIYILGADCELAPIATTGEIVIGGPGLARGYPISRR